MIRNNVSIQLNKIKMLYSNMEDKFFTPDNLEKAKLFRIGIYTWGLIQILILFPLRNTILNESFFIPLKRIDGFLGLIYNNFNIELSIIHPVILFYALFFGLLVGLFTENRVLKVLNFIGIISFHFRLGVNDGGDCLMDILFLLNIFMSEKINYKQQFIKGLTLALNNSAIYIGMIQICMVYGMAAVGKLVNPLWYNGEALYHALTIEPFVSSFSTWLASSLEMVVILNYFTIVFQVSFPFLIWNKKIRPYLIFIGTIIHLKISLLMGLMTFGLAMSCSYILFMDREKILEILKIFNFRKKIGAY